VSNTAWVKTPHRPFTPEQITESLQRTNRERFGDAFTIMYGHPEVGEGWLVCLGDESLFCFWQMTSRSLETGHPHAPLWARWAWTVFQEAFARDVGGRLHDEGVEGVWDPGPDRFPTYAEYLDLMLSHVPEERRRMHITNYYLTDEFPEELLPWRGDLPEKG